MRLVGTTIFKHVFRAPTRRDMEKFEVILLFSVSCEKTICRNFSHTKRDDG